MTTFETPEIESAAIVPAENMAALDALDGQSREVAVTHMLGQAREWLAHALESTEPKDIAAFKAQMATIAEATKQLNLSKEIQLDAQEMVRRGERGVGVAIRKGQERGELASRATPKDQGPYSRVRLGHKQEIQPQLRDPNSRLESPTKFFGNGQEQTETYALTDNVSDEQFEEAITEAKAEGNLSRANLVRKVKGYVSPEGATRAQRAEIIRQLADKGWSSRQMPDRVGVTEETVRQIARDFGVHIPADKAMGRTRRHNSVDIVENLVIGLEGSAMSVDLIDFSDLDQEQAAYWATSLTESLKVLNRFAKQIKEMTQ